MIQYMYISDRPIIQIVTCTHWTYERDTKACFLLNSKGDELTQSKAISGAKNCSPKFTFPSYSELTQMEARLAIIGAANNWDDQSEFESNGQVTEIEFRSYSKHESQVRFGLDALERKIERRDCG